MAEREIGIWRSLDEVDEAGSNSNPADLAPEKPEPQPLQTLSFLRSPLRLLSAAMYKFYRAMQ